MRTVLLVATPREYLMRRRALRSLEFRPILHGPPVAIAAVLWIGTYAWRRRRPPMTLVWNELDAEGHEHVNALDRLARARLRWRDPLRARRYSNLLAHYLVPVVASLLAVRVGRGRPGGPLSDLLVTNEAMFYAGAISQGVKLLARRQRPFARFSPEGSLAPAHQSDDDNLSFFSSHTSTTVAFAFSIRAILARRGQRSILTRALFAGAALTGYLRIASDRHYLSDVVAGGLVGAAVGTLVPRLLHPARR